MSYIFYALYIFLLYLFDCYHCLELAQGWEYLNLHCRDNSNEPVDWWYIYKPPSNLGPGMESGINFSYITPELVGRWTPSQISIFSNSMLQYTLSPMYTLEYSNYMALVVYEGLEPREEFRGSASFGLMMANEMGGLWIGHTVPGFPDLTPTSSEDGPKFPTEELKSGHMIMCLTMDLATLNSVAIAIKQTEPNIAKIFIPEKLRGHLPDWATLGSPNEFTVKTSRTSVKKTKILNFMTKDKTMRGIMLARSPGDSRCLYKSFAKTKGIVMDVYGHIEHKNVICDTRYSLRNINSISLKYPEQVYYINNMTDSMGFAVSTAGLWQRTGRNKHQFWTCTGNIENQPLNAKGGIIVCVTHFHVWLTFDNLKIKEPDCE